jgi:uncharacterized membrane protein
MNLYYQEERKMELEQFLVTSLSCSLFLILVGVWFRNMLPDKPNWVVGYRSTLSMKNKETWLFAHAYSGRIILVLGIIMALISIGVAVFSDIGRLSFDVVLGVGTSAVVLALLIAIILTEIALRKKFDKNGKRKQ